MNIKIVLLAILWCLFNLKAQDREPSAWNFLWRGTPDFRSFSIDSFQQKNFNSGFQWGTTLNMNNSLLNNGMGVHNYPTEIAGSRIYRMQITDQPVWRDSRFKEQVFNTNIIANSIFGAEKAGSKKAFEYKIKFA